MTINEFEQISQTDDPWFCPDCIKENIAFSTISDEDILCNSLGIDESLYELYSKCSEYDNETNEINASILESDSDEDPDHYFLTKCCHKYYVTKQFNSKFNTKNGLSIIHINCRSLLANFSQLVNLINSIDISIHVICLTETWLKENVDINTLSIDGYVLYLYY